MNPSHMRRAIALSRKALSSSQGGPFGAVIVKDDIIVAEGYNQVTADMDPTAHAEIVTIRLACKELGDFQLQDCEIYSSCEPCPMCLAAIYWARLKGVYFAASRQDAADAGFDDAFLYQEIPRAIGERSIPTQSMLGEDASAVLRAWKAKSDRIDY